MNDLLSDGEHSYIHRKKKDGSEEYHNLTNNVKTITSTNTDLLSVTNYNNTTNSVTLTPKLTTEYGITLSGNKLSLKMNDNFTGDVNTLTTTQWVRTTEGTTNLPTGESISDGLLEVVRVRDLVKQTYTPFNTGNVYTRMGRNISQTNEQWTNWLAYTSITNPVAVIPEVDETE